MLLSFVQSVSFSFPNSAAETGNGSEAVLTRTHAQVTYVHTRRNVNINYLNLKKSVVFYGHYIKLVENVYNVR